MKGEDIVRFVKSHNLQWQVHLEYRDESYMLKRTMKDKYFDLRRGEDWDCDGCNVC